MQTKSYSGRGGGGPLQQSALKHCQEKKKKKRTQKEEVTFFAIISLTRFLKSCLKLKGAGQKRSIIQTFYFANISSEQRSAQLKSRAVLQQNKYTC